MNSEVPTSPRRRPGRPRKIAPAPPAGPSSAIACQPSAPLELHLHAAGYEPRGLTIAEFCLAYGICTHTYRRLRKAGLGPSELKLAERGRVVITTIACLEWEAKIRNRSLPEAEAAQTLSAQLAAKGCLA